MEQLLALGLAQAAPNPVWLLDGEGVLTALLDDGAPGTECLGGFLPTLPTHAALSLW